MQRDGSVQISVVDRERWPDLERLFEARGGPKSCWCMVWRAMPDRPPRADGPSRKRALNGRVMSGQQVGLLGYLDGEPAAWCSVAPRSTYKQLGGARYEGVPDDSVWSIVCFFVKRTARGNGIFDMLLAAAIDHARDNGAKIVEGYPVDPDSPSYRFMGFVSAFEAAGFQHVGMAGSRRHVMSLRLAG